MGFHVGMELNEDLVEVSRKIQIHKNITFHHLTNISQLVDCRAKFDRIFVSAEFINETDLKEYYHLLPCDGILIAMSGFDDTESSVNYFRRVSRISYNEVRESHRLPSPVVSKLPESYYQTDPTAKPLKGICWGSSLKGVFPSEFIKSCFTLLFRACIKRGSVPFNRRLLLRRKPVYWS